MTTPIEQTPSVESPQIIEATIVGDPEVRLTDSPSAHAFWKLENVNIVPNGTPEKFDDEGLSQQITNATEMIGVLRAFLEVLENKIKYQEGVRMLAREKFHYPNFPQHCTKLLDDIMKFAPEFQFYWYGAGSLSDIPTAVIAKKIEAYKKEIDEAVASLEVLLLIKEYRELCAKRDQVSAKLSTRALETKTDLGLWFNRHGTK